MGSLGVLSFSLRSHGPSVPDDHGPSVPDDPRSSGLVIFLSKRASPSSVPFYCLHVLLPTRPLAAPFSGHDVLQLMFSAHRRAWDQSTQRPLGSAVRWFGRTVGKESHGVSVSRVWLEPHPIHSCLSGGRTWSCEATCNCWITTRRHKQSVCSPQESGEAAKKLERGGPGWGASLP